MSNTSSRRRIAPRFYAELRQFATKNGRQKGGFRYNFIVKRYHPPPNLAGARQRPPQKFSTQFSEKVLSPRNIWKRWQKWGNLEGWSRKTPREHQGEGQKRQIKVGKEKAPKWSLKRVRAALGGSGFDGFGRWEGLGHRSLGLVVRCICGSMRSVRDISVRFGRYIYRCSRYSGGFYR